MSLHKYSIFKFIDSLNFSFQNAPTIIDVGGGSSPYQKKILQKINNETIYFYISDIDKERYQNLDFIADLTRFPIKKNLAI